MATWQDVITRAENDATFRGQLKANPAAAAQQAGVSVPAGAKIEVHEDGPSDMHLVLDAQCNPADLSDEAQAVLTKAKSDAAFKAQLLSNPAAAVRQVTGASLPSSLRLHIHENSASVIHLVLPIAEMPEGELSDLELDQVAGGGRGRRRRSSGGGRGCYTCPPGTLAVGGGTSGTC